MNNLQKIASDISGYSPNGEMGAKNDFYYEIECPFEKLDFIIDFSKNAENVKIVSKHEATEIFDFLRRNYTNSSEEYHSFQDLGSHD